MDKRFVEKAHIIVPGTTFQIFKVYVETQKIYFKIVNQISSKPVYYTMTHIRQDTGDDLSSTKYFKHAKYIVFKRYFVHC